MKTFATITQLIGALSISVGASIAVAGVIDIDEITGTWHVESTVLASELTIDLPGFQNGFGQDLHPRRRYIFKMRG